MIGAEIGWRRRLLTVAAVLLTAAGCSRTSGSKSALTVPTTPLTVSVGTPITTTGTTAPSSTAPTLTNIACSPYRLTLEYASEHGPDASSTTFVESSCVDTWAIAVTGADQLSGTQELVVFQAHSGGTFEWLQAGPLPDGESTAHQAGMPLVTYDYLSSRLAS